MPPKVSEKVSEKVMQKVMQKMIANRSNVALFFKVSEKT